MSDQATPEPTGAAEGADPTPQTPTTAETGDAGMGTFDDQGRYVLPDLPKASYDIWVRGYGLVDSGKVKGQPGQQLNLTATIAPNANVVAAASRQRLRYSASNCGVIDGALAVF